VEQGAVADCIWLLREGDAAIANRLVEVLDGLETAIGERLVNEHPKMLGRLQFGAVGGLKDEVNSIGDSQVLRALPAEAGKKNQWTTASTKPASRPPRHRRAHRSTATSEMPALPKMDRHKAAA